MDLQQIKALFDAMAASDLAEMEFSEAGWSLRLVRRVADEPAAMAAAGSGAGRARRSVPVAGASPEPSGQADSLVAPLFGTVYLRPDPGSPDFVTPGASVTAGTTVCVIEAMKVFHAVRADRDGTIAAVLVTSGQDVEAGQPVVRFG